MAFGTFRTGGGCLILDGEGFFCLGFFVPLKNQTHTNHYDMRNKQLVLMLIGILSLSAVHAQQVLTINFDNIKQKIEDSTNMFYYPNLVSRAKVLDTTMTGDDYFMLYYGNVFYPAYRPYAESDYEDAMLELFDKEKYAEAITQGLLVLNENPVNLKITYYMLLCYHLSGDTQMARKYAHMFFGMLNSIMVSGDGKSIETAYVVLKVADEYMVLGDMGLTSAGQSLSGMTDVLTIETKGQDPPKGQKKIKKLYFNVEMPFGYMIKQTQKTDN